MQPVECLTILLEIVKIKKKENLQRNYLTAGMWVSKYDFTVMKKIYICMIVLLCMLWLKEWKGKKKEVTKNWLLLMANMRLHVLNNKETEASSWEVKLTHLKAWISTWLISVPLFCRWNVVGVVATDSQQNILKGNFDF